MLRCVYILLFYFLVACSPAGEIVETEELQIEFEDLWWEAIDAPRWLVPSDNTFCYFFSTARDVDPPDDGVILYYEKGDSVSYVLSNFERIEDGYYLSKYDATLEILVDENENYFAHLSQGVLSQTSEIIPCSL